MEAKLRKSIAGDDGKFRPFDVDLTIETVEEARLLYHVFNSLKVREGVVDAIYDSDKKYSECSRFFEGDLWEDIEKELTEQGFKL